MLIVPESKLRTLMSLLVSTARSGTDHHGNVPVIKTVEEATMRSAALIALTIVGGQPVDTDIPR